MSHAPRPADHGKTAPKAGAYVLAKLRELDASLTETAPRVLAEEADDEAIHDLRVAIRRMRTLLKMSRDVFGRWHTNVVRGAFAEVMRATGELRDEEVLEETLEGATEGPELDSWLQTRKAREAKLRHAVVTRLQRGDLDRARLLLKALLVFPVEPDRNVDLARFARRTVERARRKVENKRDVEVTDVTGMHDLRIAYKELRYSIELLADALPIDARAQLEPATVFQKRLGELHDVDMATEVITAAKGLPVAARERVLASLARLRMKRVNKYLRELDPLGAAERGAEKAAKASLEGDPPGVQPERNGGGPPRLPPAPDGASGQTSLEDAPTVHLQRSEPGLERRK
ncbi:MAG: CHAD domain-containing protein [Labilithrix sp.]|nr:CHAD domain-containing protein [Labilithrix sp.]